MFGIDLIALIKTAGYVGLFAIIFAETGLFFGFFLPGRQPAFHRRLPRLTRADEPADFNRHFLFRRDTGKQRRLRFRPENGGKAV